MKGDILRKSDHHNFQLTFGEKPPIKLWQTVKKVFKNITIEPVVFLYAVGFGVISIITQALYFDKICQVGSPIFGEEGKTWNETVCNNLDNGDYDEEQTYVQKTYSTINLVTMFVKGIPPIIFSLFIGPWSDKFGRRYLLILPMIGYIAYDIWFLINVIFFEEMVAEYLMLEVFQYWTGGFMCLWMGVYSYISDSSSTKTRTLRIAIVDFTFACGMAIGQGISGKINTTFGYPAVFSISLCLYCLATIYTIFFVKESRVEDVSTVTQTQGESKINSSETQQPVTFKKERPTLSAIFNLRNLKDSFQAAFKEREGGIRHVVVMLIFLFSLFMLSMMGSGMINLPYAKYKFDWESTDYFNEWWSTYEAVKTVLSCISYALLLPIMTQVLVLHDLTITTICHSSTLLSLVCILLAKSPEVLYVSAVASMCSNMTTTSIRSALTKIVGRNDVGKVFACVAAITAVVDFVSPLYNLVYRETIEWHPGFAYCLSSMILIVMIVMTIYCRWYARRWSKAKENKDMNYEGANHGIPFQPRFRSINNDLNVIPVRPSRKCDNFSLQRY